MASRPGTSVHPNEYREKSVRAAGHLAERIRFDLTGIGAAITLQDADLRDAFPGKIVRSGRRLRPFRWVAERVGFEPTAASLLRRFSRPVP